MVTVAQVVIKIFFEFSKISNFSSQLVPKYSSLSLCSLFLILYTCIRIPGFLTLNPFIDKGFTLLKTTFLIDSSPSSLDQHNLFETL